MNTASEAAAPEILTLTKEDKLQADTPAKTAAAAVPTRSKHRNNPHPRARSLNGCIQFSKLRAKREKGACKAPGAIPQAAIKHSEDISG
jgi:hypothetical protein